MKKSHTLLIIIRILLGAVFVVSGFQKLAVPAENFQAVIDKFEVVQGPAGAFLSHAIPWWEFIFGIFLILGLWTTQALLALWSLNVLLIGVVFSALFRKLPIEECGCFGEALSLPLPAIFAVDIGLCVLFAVFFFFSRGSRLPGLDSFFKDKS